MPIFPSQLTEKITLKLLWIENLKKEEKSAMKLGVDQQFKQPL